MKIRITKGGIFGAKGEVAVGTELDVKEEPTGWAGRYEVIGNGGGGEPVTNPADVDQMSEDELKAHLKAKNIQFPADAKKTDLVKLAKK